VKVKSISLLSVQSEMLIFKEMISISPNTVPAATIIEDSEVQTILAEYRIERDGDDRRRTDSCFEPSSGETCRATLWAVMKMQPPEASKGEIAQANSQSGATFWFATTEVMLPDMMLFKSTSSIRVKERPPQIAIRPSPDP
jgi:hypothetical protein